VSITSKISSGLGWNTLTVVLQVVIQLVYTGILARLVSKDSFMLMGIVLGIMGFAEIFSQIGIGPALIQRKEVDQQHINSGFYSAFIPGVIFTLLFIVLAPAIASFYRLEELTDIVRVVCTSFTISALALIPRSLMTKDLQFKQMFKAGMISIVGGNLIVGLVLAWMGFQVWAYVWALFAQNALMTIALWYYHPVKITGSWSWSATKDLIRYGTASTLFNALNYLATKLDVLVLPRFMRGSQEVLTDLQKAEASYYERAGYAMSQPITIMGKLSDSVLFSGMSKLQDDGERLAKMLLLSIRVISLLLIPVSVYLVFFAGSLIQLWLGNEFLSTAGILKILFWAVIFRSLSKLGDSLLRAKDAVFIGSGIKAVYVVLMSIGIYFTANCGMEWVSMAVVVATMIHFAMNMHLCTQLIPVRWSQIFSALAPALLLGLALWPLCWFLHLAILFTGGNYIFALLTSLALVLFFTVSIILLFPLILGKKENCILKYLPVAFQKNKISQYMMKKCGII
jgi:O-antigen/teichoic acid export membrane protein